MGHLIIMSLQVLSLYYIDFFRTQLWRQMLGVGCQVLDVGCLATPRSFLSLYYSFFPGTTLVSGVGCLATPRSILSLLYRFFLGTTLVSGVRCLVTPRSFLSLYYIDFFWAQLWCQVTPDTWHQTCAHKKSILYRERNDLGVTRHLTPDTKVVPRKNLYII